MALFSKSSESARAEVQKAMKTVAEWELRVADVQAEAAEIEANSGTLIFADPSEAERIGQRIQGLEQKASSFVQAAVVARQKLNMAQRSVIEVEAKEEERLASAAAKELAAHDSKVSGLLAQLKEVDGCDYTIGRMIEGYGAELGERQIPNSVSLRRRQVRHSTRAAVLKYFIRTGEIAGNYYDLNNELGTNFNGLGASIAEVDGIPGIVGEYRAAGLTFAKAGA